MLLLIFFFFSTQKSTILCDISLFFLRKWNALLLSCHVATVVMQRREKHPLQASYRQSDTDKYKDGQITSPMSDLVFHKALRARRAVFSNISSPVSRLSVANSRMNVPTPAVHVTGVSVGLTPFRRFTVPYGIPVAVWNAMVIHSSELIHESLK